MKEHLHQYILAATLLVSASMAEATGFTSRTAPDAISRDILANELVRINVGAHPRTDPSQAIHRNFPQIIEQNFAKLDARGMAELVDALSDAELSDLAQLYTNATSDHGRPSKLIYVIAHRLDARRLGRVSRHFGFAEIYGAVTAISPSKVQMFLASSDTRSYGPAPGEMRFGPAGRFAPTAEQHRQPMRPMSYVPAFYSPKAGALRGDMQQTAFGQFLSYTPYEIYLSFRTAPVGALAVTGALWETAVVLSSMVGTAYASGYAVGTYVVAPMIQTYAPNLYNAIGGTVAGMVENLSTSWATGLNAMGYAQSTTASVFQSTSSQISSFSNYGGDFGVSYGWTNSSYGGGGGGGGCSLCWWEIQ